MKLSRQESTVSLKVADETFNGSTCECTHKVGYHGPPGADFLCLYCPNVLSGYMQAFKVMEKSRKPEAVNAFWYVWQNKARKSSEEQLLWARGKIIQILWRYVWCRQHSICESLVYVLPANKNSEVSKAWDELFHLAWTRGTPTESLVPLTYLIEEQLGLCILHIKLLEGKERSSSQSIVEHLQQQQEVLQYLRKFMEYKDTGKLYLFGQLAYIFQVMPVTAAFSACQCLAADDDKVSTGVFARSRVHELILSLLSATL